MHFLSNKLTTYSCKSCGWSSNSATVHVNGYGDYECPHCEMEVIPTGECDATFWSVAVYETERRYGGPEEGGWYYEFGHLVNPAKVRVFESHAEAEAYQDSLWDQIEPEDKRGENRLVVVGWTEKLPDTHWPRVRPHYC